MSRLHAVVNNVQECALQTAHKPEYARIASKTQLAFEMPFSPEQQSDRSKPTPEEDQEILAWNRDVRACRQPLLVETATELPTLHEALLRSQVARDDIFVDLEKGQTTWGDANGRLQKFSLESRQQVSAGLQPYLQAMDAQNQQEIAQRMEIARIMLNVAAGAALHAHYTHNVRITTVR